MAILDVIQMTQSCRNEGNQENNEIFGIILPQDLLEDTRSSLAKPAVFSRVKLGESSFRVFGLYVKSNLEKLHFQLPERQFALIKNEMGYCYQIDESCYILLIKQESVAELTDYFLKKDQYKGSLAWHTLQLQHKRIELYPNSKGLFLPHRLDMHLSGHISFDKGCYKGQEIIARMHYRATQKHKLIATIITMDREPQLGEALYNDKEQDHLVGELVDYSPLGNNQYIIAASIGMEYPEDGPLFTNNLLC